MTGALTLVRPPWINVILTSRGGISGGPLEALPDWPRPDVVAADAVAAGGVAVGVVVSGALATGVAFDVAAAEAGGACGETPRSGAAFAGVSAAGAF